MYLLMFHFERLGLTQAWTLFTSNSFTNCFCCRHALNRTSMILHDKIALWQVPLNSFRHSIFTVLLENGCLCHVFWHYISFLRNRQNVALYPTVFKSVATCGNNDMKDKTSRVWRKTNPTPAAGKDVLSTIVPKATRKIETPHLTFPIPTTIALHSPSFAQVALSRNSLVIVY